MVDSNFYTKPALFTDEDGITFSSTESNIVSMVKQSTTENMTAAMEIFNERDPMTINNAGDRLKGRQSWDKIPF